MNSFNEREFFGKRKVQVPKVDEPTKHGPLQYIKLNQQNVVERSQGICQEATMAKRNWEEFNGKPRPIRTFKGLFRVPEGGLCHIPKATQTTWNWNKKNLNFLSFSFRLLLKFLCWNKIEIHFYSPSRKYLKLSGFTRTVKFQESVVWLPSNPRQVSQLNGQRRTTQVERLFSLKISMIQKILQTSSCHVQSMIKTQTNAMFPLIMFYVTDNNNV